MNNRPSYAQMEKMIEFMEENPQLAKGLMRCTLGRYETKLKWEELSSILNSMEGLKKDTKQWIRFWADKKYGIKRRLIAQRNATAYRQRCGLDDESPPLSHLDDRIVLLMGGKKSHLSDKKPEPVVKPKEAPAEQPKPNISHAISTKASQTTPPPMLRRSPRIRTRHLRSQFNQERQRLIDIEERRVKAETAGWRMAAGALNHLAKAVVQCGQIVADAMITRHF